MKEPEFWILGPTTPLISTGSLYPPPNEPDFFYAFGLVDMIGTGGYIYTVVKPPLLLPAF